MKILIIHNKYGKHSGEESVVYAHRDLLVSKGNAVDTYFRSSEEIRGFGGQLNAFFSGFYNRRSANEIRLRTADCGLQTGDEGRPDIVHIHNLYPLISPAILPIIKKSPPRHLATSPPHHLTTSPPKIVMTVHNYRLICPNGLFFTHGAVCEKCSGGKEWNCIKYNCEKSLLKSTGYALRNWWARRKRYYLDNVDAFLCLTEFQKAKLVGNGYPAEKCFVLPNFLDAGEGITGNSDKKHVLFAGRVNQQKGFDLLTQAAESLDQVPFFVAGGNLNHDEMQTAYGQARFLAFTSRSYEGFPMVFPEAMKHRLPVIAPNMAGFPEIIEDGVNGLLFRPGDADDLAAKIRILWNDEELCRKLGENGYRKLQEKYSPEIYYRKLMDVYESLLV